MSPEFTHIQEPDLEYAERMRFGGHTDGNLTKYSGLPESGVFDAKHFLDTALIASSEVQDAANGGDLSLFDQDTQEKLKDGSLRLAGEGVPKAIEHAKFDKMLLMAVGEVAFRDYVDKIMIVNSELKDVATEENNMLELASRYGLSEDQAYIFAPIVEPEQEPRSVDDIVGDILGDSDDYYSRLFTDTDEDFNKNRSTESAAVSGDTGIRTVTDDSEQDAISALEHIQDFVIKDEVDHYAREYGIKNAKEKVKLIRTNAELRYKLAKGLLRKLEGLVGGSSLPERVGRVDEMKSPARQYGKNATLPSRDYVVALSLSMLDGTFDNTSTDTEPKNTPLSMRTHGQHRGVARALLFNEY